MQKCSKHGEEVLFTISIFIHPFYCGK